MSPRSQSSRFHHAGPANNAIRVDDATTYQTIDGFGHAVTGGTAQLMMKMSPASRHALLEDLFGRAPGQRNMSYIRISVGASDMNEFVYTYDDLPEGSTDPTLAHFSLAPDETYVIPVLKGDSCDPSWHSDSCVAVDSAKLDEGQRKA